MRYSASRLSAAPSAEAVCSDSGIRLSDCRGVFAILYCFLYCFFVVSLYSVVDKVRTFRRLLPTCPSIYTHIRPTIHAQTAPPQRTFIPILP